jgi:hypothetical protein
MADLVQNLVLGANVAGLQKGLSDAATATADAANKIKAENQKLITSTETIGNSQKSLAQQYRAASREAQIQVEQNGLLSQSGLAAARSAGKLKDELEDYKIAEKALGSDAPVFTAMAGAMRSLSGGFAAAQGAAALFGEKSKDVEQAILKVQAAMATQGLVALSEAPAAFIALKAVIIADVLPAIASIGATTAIATGGLTLVLGALVALTVQTMGETKKSQETYIQLIYDSARAQASLNDAIQDSTNKQRALSLLQAEATGDKTVLAREKAKQEYQIAVEGNRKMYLESQKNVFDQMRYRDTLKALNEIYKNNIKEIDNQILDDKKKNNVEILKEIDKQYIQDEQAKKEGLKKANWEIKNMKYTGGTKSALGNDLLPTVSFKSVKLPPLLDLNALKTDLINTKKGIENAYNELEETSRESVKNLNNSLNQALVSGVNNTLSSAFSKLGENIGKGENPFKGMGDLLMQSFGALMQQMGAAMLSWGIAQTALGAAIELGPLGAPLAIAGGLALIAAGVAISAANSSASSFANGSSSSGGGGGTPSGPVATFGGGNNMVLSLNGVVRGNNILVTATRSGYERSRVR